VTLTAIEEVAGGVSDELDIRIETENSTKPSLVGTGFTHVFV